MKSLRILIGILFFHNVILICLTRFPILRIARFINDDIRTREERRHGNQRGRCDSREFFRSTLGAISSYSLTGGITGCDSWMTGGISQTVCTTSSHFPLEWDTFTVMRQVSLRRNDTQTSLNVNVTGKLARYRKVKGELMRAYTYMYVRMCIINNENVKQRE